MSQIWNSIFVVSWLCVVWCRVVSSTNPHWARVMGYGSFSLCVIHKKGLCPTSGGINRLMMMRCGVWDRAKEYHLSLSSMDVIKAARGITALPKRQTSAVFLIAKQVHLYIPLTPHNGSRDISDIPPRRPRFTKTI
jgi:hypothetical protein